MWLEQKYIGLISNRLDRFKRVNSKSFNFRCPVCGDSRKSKYKARGYIFEKDKGGFIYYCHNCNVTLSIDKLIETVDPVVYQEFVREKISSGFTDQQNQRVVTPAEELAKKMKKPTFIKATALNSLRKVSQLKWDHPVKQYVQNRKIPNKYHSKLFYAPRFKEFVNNILPNKFESLKNDEPRLVIPLIDKEKNLLGFQGRSFKKDSIRYITIMLDKNHPKIFNLDECDQNKIHYILEGPIDSMFVDNSVAMAGGTLDWNYVNENSVFVYDNEPRSKETCDKIKKVIDKGYKVCIFPEHINQKDINDMVLANPRLNVNELLESNISSGLEARIIFTAWRKI